MEGHVDNVWERVFGLGGVIAGSMFAIVELVAGVLEEMFQNVLCLSRVLQVAGGVFLSAGIAFIIRVHARVHVRVHVQKI